MIIIVFKNKKKEIKNHKLFNELKVIKSYLMFFKTGNKFKPGKC